MFDIVAMIQIYLVKCVWYCCSEAVIQIYLVKCGWYCCNDTNIFSKMCLILLQWSGDTNIFSKMWLILLQWSSDLNINNGYFYNLITVTAAAPSSPDPSSLSPRRVCKSPADRSSLHHEPDQNQTDIHAVSKLCALHCIVLLHTSI